MDNSPHRSEYIFYSLVVLGFTIVKNIIFALILSSRSVFGGFLWWILVPVFICAGVPFSRLLIFLDAS